jgi:2-polyprenyl-3-methyl-5-hydroxy-6-metoxy-1,4-benzoquinol methylase
MNIDKAGERYWDHVWENTPSLYAVDLHALGLNNYVNRKFHEYFQKVFSGMDTNDKRLLEIGCANSQWLPYFVEEFGFKVTGIDSSEIGCLKAREILSNAGVRGEVLNADFFYPPAGMSRAFDVVISFGVVEHFENTVDCINAFKQFMNTGAVIITVIPNLMGILGLLQKILNDQIYDKHVPLDNDMLQRAHDLSGFGNLKCNYFLSNSFGIINLNGLNPDQKRTRVKALLMRNLSRLSKVIWKIEETIGNFRASKLLSPYIICIGKITS